MRMCALTFSAAGAWPFWLAACLYRRKRLPGSRRVARPRYPSTVVLGPDGALYFTDPTLDLVKGEKQGLPYKGIFRMESTGALKLLATDIPVPNGIAFSPDGKHLYVNDTRAREIRVYDFSHGEMKNERLFAKEGPG
jgi:gluconolactonase